MKIKDDTESNLALRLGRQQSQAENRLGSCFGDVVTYQRIISKPRPHIEDTRHFIPATQRAKTQTNKPGASALQHQENEMKTNTTHQTYSIQSGAWLPALVGLALLAASAASARADDNRAPEVPDEIAVPPGNKVHFHGFAVGVQIYTWNGADWGSAVPEATLFHGEGIVVSHFGGPTWESNSGSQVVGALPPQSVMVDPDAIPWLLLAAVKERTHGPGIFANTTYIHRVNTSGGKAPSTDGAFIGQVARVPYSADYFFYRKTNH